jgi:hypothetical protein
MFENSPNEAPIASRLYDPILLDNVSVIGNLTPNAWQDLQGAFRITMLSGSAQFGQIFIGAQVPGANGGLEYYGMVLTQIPEPTAIKVLAIGGLCVGLGFWMKRRRSYVVASMCCI